MKMLTSAPYWAFTYHPSRKYYTEIWNTLMSHIALISWGMLGVHILRTVLPFEGTFKSHNRNNRTWGLSLPLRLRRWEGFKSKGINAISWFNYTISLIYHDLSAGDLPFYKEWFQTSLRSCSQRTIKWANNWTTMFQLLSKQKGGNKEKWLPKRFNLD